MDRFTQILSYGAGLAVVFIIFIIMALAYKLFVNRNKGNLKPMLLENIQYTQKLVQVGWGGKILYYAILKTPIVWSEYKDIEAIRLTREQYESYGNTGILNVYLDEYGCVTQYDPYQTKN